jgi:hypothetical protein
MAIASLVLLLPAVRASADAQFIPLGFLPNGNFGSTAAAVSDQAPYVVVGSANTQQLSQLAYRWTQAGGMQAIGSVQSDAADVSADGTVVVGSNTSGNAWRWTLASGVKTNIGTGDSGACSTTGRWWSAATTTAVGAGRKGPARSRCRCFRAR